MKISKVRPAGIARLSGKCPSTACLRPYRKKRLHTVASPMLTARSFVAVTAVLFASTTDFLKVLLTSAVRTRKLARNQIRSMLRAQEGR
jgi:hypothetical protein